MLGLVAQFKRRFTSLPALGIKGKNGKSNCGVKENNNFNKCAILDGDALISCMCMGINTTAAKGLHVHVFHCTNKHTFQFLLLECVP